MELFWSHTIRGLKPTANISGRYATHDFVGINRLIDLMTRRTPLAGVELISPLRLPQHRLE
jgi:hypothetical protein